MRRALLLLLLVGCTAPTGWEAQSLEGYPNPMKRGHPRWDRQPHRDNPRELAADAHGGVWVSLQGSRDHPGNEIARIDVASGEIERIDTLGSNPTGLSLHPDGRWLVVFHRFSNFATVVDTVERVVVDQLPADFYASEGVFTPDGKELWVSNRWRDAVAVWTIKATDTRLQIVDRLQPAIKVMPNPRDIAISADGRWIAVGSPTSTEASLIDVRRHRERRRLDIGAPANGVAFVDDMLIVATTSTGTGHPEFLGADGDGDGLPGDGTPNTLFSDIQNELATYRVPSGNPLVRYTSDSVCCLESSDLNPGTPTSEWIVTGALPQQIATARRDGTTWAWVTYSASNEVQRLEVDADAGTLAPAGTWSTGHEPHGVTVRGNRVWVAHRLGETVGAYDIDSGKLEKLHEVGDLSESAFPATDAEIGELVANVTGPLTGDGDQSCAHCHPRGSNIGQAFALSLGRYTGVTMRMTMPFGGLVDSAPWFWEGMVDETDFVPVGLERPEDLSPTEMIARSEALIGRAETFDGRPLDFEVLSDTMATFLITDTHLLPNPNPVRGDLVKAGRALFNRNDVGCAVCHPAPAFAATTTNNPFSVLLKMGPVVSPARYEGVNVDLLSDSFVRNFPRAKQDRCADLCDFLECQVSPAICDDLRVVRFGIPSLRGLWDRTPGFLHDGRADNLREVLCTPGHPALKPGETGYNESDGIIDTHGGTSHLGEHDIDALIAYMLTL